MPQIHIALCEDDARCRGQLTALVEEWLLTRPALSGQLTAFESGQALLDALESGERFSLYLLDVLMPGPNGIQTGAALRRREEPGEIIYLTSTPDFAVDSYAVGAFFYLLKPVERRTLFDILDKAAARLELRRGAGIILSTAQGEHHLLLDDILYVERTGRRARYVCFSETVETLSLQTSFKESIRPLLADGRFISCGASFALNLQRVTTVKGQTAVMTGGVSITLPRTACTEFKRAWGEYWLKEAVR